MSAALARLLAILILVGVITLGVASLWSSTLERIALP